VLRLPPKAFWGATPAEIGAAARGLAGLRAAPPPLSGDELAGLMARYPDASEVRHG
jgi:uncharacterized phage protein (TIGR02216 family)